MPYYMNNQSEKKQSFFRRHWALTFCSICFFLLCAYIYVITDGKPLETAKNFLDNLTDNVVEEIAPAQQVKSEWELAEEDQRDLRPVVDQYFEAGTEYKMQPYSAEEVAALRRQHPVLAGNNGYFTRIEGTYFYVSKDGQRIYDCQVAGELLADKMAREARQAQQSLSQHNTASSYRSVDESGIVIYSPSDLSGDSLDNLAKDPSMKGIFRDADGTWKNY